MDGRKQSMNKKKKKQKANILATVKIMCAGCTKSMSAGYFYVSSSRLHSNGRVPYCKTCVKKMICDEKGNVFITKVQNTLQLLDKPFINVVWASAMNKKGDTFGSYLAMLSLPACNRLTWKDSVFDEEVERSLNYNQIEREVVKKELFNIEVDDDLILKWGFGYPDDEYKAFERKYQLLKENYPEKTAMHTEALLNYIRYRVKEEIATAKGDVKDAKEWGGLADKQATAAKINPSQLSKADLQDGLNTFGELVRAVEQSLDIIPILPHFKDSPQDKPDFVLWCYINYIRDLKGISLCEYKDIYKFYEKRKKDYAKKHSDKAGDLIGKL